MAKKSDVKRNELLKPTNRQRALELLAECKRKESRMKLVTVRLDKQTVILMSTIKAKKKGYGNKKMHNL